MPSWPSHPFWADQVTLGLAALVLPAFLTQTMFSHVCSSPGWPSLSHVHLQNASSGFKADSNPLPPLRLLAGCLLPVDGMVPVSSLSHACWCVGLPRRLWGKGRH